MECHAVLSDEDICASVQQDMDPLPESDEESAEDPWPPQKPTDAVRSMMLVEGTVEEVAGGLWLLEEIAVKELPVAVTRGLTELQSSWVVMQVLKISEYPVKLYKGMTVGVLQRVKDGIPEVDKQEMLQNLVEEASAELSPGEKDIFHQFLLSFADIMACSTSENRQVEAQHPANLSAGSRPIDARKCSSYLVRCWRAR